MNKETSVERKIDEIKECTKWKDEKKEEEKQKKKKKKKYLERKLK